MPRDTLVDSRFTGVRRNLFTNPSFETPGATNGLTVRTNWALDPRATQTATWHTWAFSSGTGGIQTQQVVTGAADGPVLPDGSRSATYRRATTTTAATGGSPGPYTQATVAGTLGDLGVAGMFMRCNRAVTGTIYHRFYAAGVVVGATSYPVTTIPNEWMWLVSTIVPATADYDAMRVWFVPGPGADMPQVGDVYDWTCALFERAPLILPYFDALTAAPDADLNHAWSGTANASTSVERATSVASISSSAVAQTYSTLWSKNRTKSMRLIPIPSAAGLNTGTSFASWGSNGSNTTGTVPGKTYTLSATCRLKAAQTGTLSGSSRKIALQYNNVAGSTGAIIVASPPAPNVPGETRLSVTATLPADTVWVRVIFYNGATTGNGDVWYDAVLLEEGTSAGPYFDGASRNAAWTGAVDGSASVGNGYVGRT